MADWRETLRQVLQGVTTPPALPQSFVQPQASIPLPALGRFGMQALNLAGLPSSIPTRNIAAAPFVPLPPSGPVGDGSTGEGPAGPPPPITGTNPEPIADVLDQLANQGVPVVPGNDSRIPDPYGDGGVMGDSSQPPPVTYPTPPFPFFDSPDAVSVPPAHLGPDFVGPTQPENPVAPYAPYVPGQTTTEHSRILDPGTTVGDFLTPPPAPNATPPSASDWLTNPIGATADVIGGFFAPSYDWANNPDYANVANPWTGNPLNSPLELTDPFSGSSNPFSDPFANPFNDSYDPFDLSRLTPEQRQALRDMGYIKDA